MTFKELKQKLEGQFIILPSIPSSPNKKIPHFIYRINKAKFMRGLYGEETLLLCIFRLCNRRFGNKRFTALIDKEDLEQAIIDPIATFKFKIRKKELGCKTKISHT